MHTWKVLLLISFLVFSVHCEQKANDEGQKTVVEDVQQDESLTNNVEDASKGDDDVDQNDVADEGRTAKDDNDKNEADADSNNSQDADDTIDEQNVNDEFNSVEDQQLSQDDTKNALDTIDNDQDEELDEFNNDEEIENKGLNNDAGYKSRRRRRRRRRRFNIRFARNCRVTTTYVYRNRCRHVRRCHRVCFRRYGKRCYGWRNVCRLVPVHCRRVRCLRVCVNHKCQYKFCKH